MSCLQNYFAFHLVFIHSILENSLPRQQQKHSIATKHTIIYLSQFTLFSIQIAHTAQHEYMYEQQK